jgi:hypothetical protein
MERLLLTLLLCPFLALSQEKKDNVIVVTLADSTRNFEQVIEMLTAQKYKASRTPNSEEVLTQRSYIKKFNTPFSYNFRVEGNTVRIHGWFYFDNIVHPVLFNWGGFKIAWKEMDRLAKLLGTTTYSKEEISHWTHRRKKR